MKQIFCVLLLLILVISCNSESKIQQSKKYFDLKGLIEKQIKILNAQKPIVEKSIMIADSAENQFVNTIDWAKELELFIQADLNKPAFVQSYQVDSFSMGVRYTLKNTEKLPVKYLNMRRIGEDGISIEAFMSKDNYLYQTERTLKFFLRNSQIVDYQIDGFQKIIFGDKKVFRIKGIIQQ